MARQKHSGSSVVAVLPQPQQSGLTRRRVRLAAAGAAVCLTATTLIAVVSPSSAAPQVAQNSPLQLDAATAQKSMIRLEITERESPTFEGRSFGKVGQYEYLIGKAHGQLDPKDPKNTGIVNLDRAPRNAKGFVEYSVDTTILKPVDPKKANGRIFYDVVNRGGQRSLTHRVNGGANGNDPRDAADAGTGWLMEQGYTMVWSAWQADVPDNGQNMVADFPITKKANGEPITQMTRREWAFGNLTSPIVGDLVYPASNLNKGLAQLTVRQNERDPRQVVNTWNYVDEKNIVITRPAGFDNNAIYEFVYEAKDPTVMGIGFAATRDIISFLRHDTSKNNPVATQIQVALGMGISQSGRYLRDFVYQGFNADLSGRKVFEGILPFVAGSRKTMVNLPFSVPGDYSRQHETHTAPGDQFPFTYPVIKDPISGKEDGILKKCQSDTTCPKVLHIDTDTEFFQARASLVVTDTLGRDLKQPADVRVYMLADANHTADQNADKPDDGKHHRNPIQYGVHSRALIKAMDDWVSTGKQPPASQFPSVAAGTLVPPDSPKAQYPKIPGWTYNGLVNELRLLDHSSTIPIEGASYPVLVGAKDADGNNVTGLHHPLSAVPTGTHAGWNLTAAGYAENALLGLTGSYSPFALTRGERLANGDERLSISERYHSQAAYVKELRMEANAQVKARTLLKQDADVIVAEAQANGTDAVSLAGR
jgi:hypothetical protein